MPGGHSFSREPTPGCSEAGLWLVFPVVARSALLSLPIEHLLCTHSVLHVNQSTLLNPRDSGYD